MAAPFNVALKQESLHSTGRTRQTALHGLLGLPDEHLVEILHLSLRGETIVMMPQPKQQFRPSWAILRRTCSTLRRIANDPQVILPQPNAHWVFSSAHAVNCINRAIQWMGIAQSFSAAYNARPSTGLLEPKVSPRHVSIRVVGQWSRRGQKEFERWHKAVQALPDLVSIDGVWTMTFEQYDRTANYLTLIEDTINGADAPNPVIHGVSMLQYHDVLGDGAVSLKFLLKKMA